MKFFKSRSEELETAPEMAPEAAPVRSTGKKIILILILLLLIAGGTAFYFYRKAVSLEANPQIQAQQEVNDLVARVSRLMVLPTDETPIVATVLDPAALASQPFFANAKKGDKVLIYNNARKAILYSPAIDKIVEVGPIIIQSQNAAANTPPATQPSTNGSPTQTKK